MSENLKKIAELLKTLNSEELKVVYDAAWHMNYKLNKVAELEFKALLEEGDDNAN